MFTKRFSLIEFFEIFIFLTTLSSSTVTAAKPYFSLCKDNSDCGLNAMCHKSSRCQYGRCLCISDEYRPYEMRRFNGDVAYGTDCARILRLGENCTGGLDAQRIDMGSGHTCTDGEVKCQSDYFVREGNKCKFSEELKPFGEDCSGNKTCNFYLGLVCANDTVTKRCRCPPFERFFEDRRFQFGGMCAPPGNKDRCDGDEQCSGFTTKAVGGRSGHMSVCRGPPFKCKCNEPYFVPMNYAISWENNTWSDYKVHCVKNMPVKANIGGTCWIANPMHFMNLETQNTMNAPIICKKDLVCYSCPEYNPGLRQPVPPIAIPMPGICVSMHRRTSDNSTATMPFVNVVVIGILSALQFFTRI